MKRKYSLFFAILFITLNNFNATAQKSINEGKVVYAISYPDMDLDPQMQAMMPTESVVFFKGVYSRTDLSLGMGFSSSSIMNAKSGEVIALTDVMGSKSAMKMSAADLKKAKSENKTAAPAIELTSEVKKIAGYNCKKAIVKSGESALEVFYTDEISAVTASTIDWKEIKGFPMEYFLDQNGLKMKFTAKSVTAEKVGDDLFVIPKDYKLVTQEEMMKKLSGE
jgi:hypothetical protein